MNNAGMDGYSLACDCRGCLPEPESTPSHGETMHGPVTREGMGHGEYQTLWLADMTLVIVECYCGWRARSTKRLTAVERLMDHAGTPFSADLRHALDRVSA